jgi:predicted ArsR family transcriptional regulator
MKANFWLWKPFYDFDIAEENKNIFKLHVWNCPFCECLNGFGLTGLSPYVCEGDWAIARDNIDKWDFERSHQIGTGDSFCDHTYKRKQRKE